MPQDTATTDTLIAAVAVAALVLAVLALAAALVVGSRLRRAGRGPVGGGGSTDPLLHTVLEQYQRRLETVRSELDEVATRTGILEVRADRAVSRIGVVRFNPFEDTGSNQSFVLALLDEHGDGVVINSLHARQASRIYAKPIVRGRSETALSAEENEALRMAMAGPARVGAPNAPAGRRR